MIEIRNMLHTPGPWLPVKVEVPGHVNWIAVHRNGRLTEKGAEGEANARLIAMAPTLLAAGIQALARWPISLRGSPLEKAVYEAQGLPPPPPEERRQVDLAGMARASFAVPTPED